MSIVLTCAHACFPLPYCLRRWPSEASPLPPPVDRGAPSQTHADAFYMPNAPPPTGSYTMPPELVSQVGFIPAPPSQRQKMLPSNAQAQEPPAPQLLPHMPPQPPPPASVRVLPPQPQPQPPQQQPPPPQLPLSAPAHQLPPGGASHLIPMQYYAQHPSQWPNGAVYEGGSCMLPAHPGGAYPPAAPAMPLVPQQVGCAGPHPISSPTCMYVPPNHPSGAPPLMGPPPMGAPCQVQHDPYDVSTYAPAPPEQPIMVYEQPGPAIDRTPVLASRCSFTRVDTEAGGTT